jgi:spore coat protein U-like protein
MTRLAIGLDLIMGAALLTLPGKADAAACGTAVSPVTVSATGVAFGAYDATAPAATTANGTIRIACELGVDVLPNFIVHLSSGNAAGFWPRHMRTGNNRLTYNLFTDAAHATVWGDGTDGTSTHTNTEVLPMGNVDFTVHGVLPPGQFVPGGIYTDTIVVRVEY